MEQEATPEMKQNRMTEFLKLLPLTLELAGLAKADPARPFTPDQIEGRALSVRTAFKAARTLIREIGEKGV